MFRLVPHGSAEYDQLVELRRLVLRIPLGLDFSPEQLAAENDDLHLSLWEGDRPVACMILTLLDAETVQMRQFAVDPTLQRTGLGTLLVDHAEQLARERGFHRMILHARESAVPFYLRLGYALEGEPFTEVGLPHRHMSKAL